MVRPATYVDGVSVPMAAPQLDFGDIDAQYVAPLQVAGDEGGDVRAGRAHQCHIICKAGRGDAEAGYLHAVASGDSPAVEGFKEDVEKVRAGGAALGKAVGGLPNFTIKLAIAEATAEEGVEGGIAIHHRGGDAGMAEGAEDGPPGHGVEALLDIKARHPKLMAATALQGDEVAEELGEVGGAGLGAEAHGCMVEELGVKVWIARRGWCPCSIGNTVPRTL